jgi:hypothetical protein
VDRLSCSLHKLSISSPSESSGSIRHGLGSPETKAHSTESSSGVQSVSSNSGTSIRSSLSNSKPRPWKGPLPLPRVSPKLSLGDAMDKDKVLRSPSSVTATSARRSAVNARVDSEDVYPIRSFRSKHREWKFKFEARFESFLGRARVCGLQSDPGNGGPAP